MGERVLPGKGHAVAWNGDEAPDTSTRVDGGTGPLARTLRSTATDPDDVEMRGRGDGARQGNDMNERLPRVIGPVVGTLMIVSWTIGTGIFLVPGIVARHAGSITTSLLLWLLVGGLTFCGGLCYAELSTRVPRSGAEYCYLHAGYGPFLGFLCAWVFLFAQPAAIAGVARGFADYLSVLWPMEESLRRAVAAGTITVLASISVSSTRAGTQLAALAGIGKLLALLGVAWAGIAMTQPVAEVAAASGSPGWHLAQLGMASVAIIWAFDGFSAIALMAGEVHEPQRNLPRCLFTAIAVVTLAYLLINAVYFYTLGFDGVAASDTVAAAALSAVFGSDAGKIVTVLIMASALGTGMVQVVGNPRGLVAPAEDGLLPRAIAAVSPRTRTPANAILLTCGIAIVLTTLGGYEFLTRVYVLSFYPVVLLALTAAVRLRHREGPPTTFSMPFYPWPLVIYVTGIAGICIASAVEDPVGALLGLMLPLSGALVYAARSWFRPLLQEG